MDYNEMQLIWDEQNKRTLFAFDREVLEREVMKESTRSRFHLRGVEHASSVTLLGVSVVIGFETYLQGEYFQIGGILIILIAATVVFFSGRNAELRLQNLGMGVVADLEKGILRTQRVIALIRNLFIGFCCYLVYGTVVRGIVYEGFAHSEVKLIASIVGPVLMYLLLRWEVKMVHGKRLAKLQALSTKLSENE